MHLDWNELKAQLYTAVIADILDDLGLREQVMEPALRPLDPDTVLAGLARTMLAVPEFEIPARPYQNQIAATDTLRPGDVVVAHVSRITASAFWGELFSTAALARGAAGAVTDGYVRDVRQIRQMNFPVYAAGIYPVNSKGRCTLASYDVPVRCGGVLVRSGDLIFGDIDGIVVVPAEWIHTVIPKALEVARRENRMKQELLQGSLLQTAWDKYQVL
jgi:regulator of RNase E activity RraA